MIFCFPRRFDMSHLFNNNFFNFNILTFSFFTKGIFEWGMLYKEGPLPEKEAQKRSRHSEPYNAPTHAGGLFAIRRDWFKQLGWYDPG